MSSRSASPSITTFFKVQRKRPRTGKEDVVSASKKLLLEGAPESSVVAELKGKEGSKSDDSVSKLMIEGNAKEVDSSKLKESSEKNEKEVAVIKTTNEAGENGSKLPTSESNEGDGNYPSTSKSSDASGSKGLTSKPSEGSVKFLKLGALSPAKRNKMTTEQVAKILKKKKKLSDLKSALEGMNQCAQKLSEFRRTCAEANAKMSPVQPAKEADSNSGERLNSSATKSIKGMSPSQFYSPTADRTLKADLNRLSASKVPASPSKLVNLNNKVKKRLFEEQISTSEGEKKLPAYQRFNHLAQKTAPEKGTVSAEEAELILPYHFKVLKELFIGVETVLGIMKGRKEIVTFPKVKAGVLELVRRKGLQEKHLAQMVTVLPGCYTFGLEKVGLQTHLTIDVEELVPSVVCARRKAFHAALIKICLEHHKKFLLSLNPPIVVPADKQITRWHPNFKIDEIPDIIPKEDVLPIKPAPEKMSTARDVIAKAQNILEYGNPRMKQAMKNMVNNSGSNDEENTQATVIEPKPKPAATLKSIKGVSQSLLEKIRNREKEKLLNEMTRSPAESKKLQMMKRLPNFVKIIRNMMVAEKKHALPMDIVIDRVSHSIQNMSAGDTAAHIRLLTTLCPHWAKIHKLSHSDMEYLRIDKAIDINTLLEEMEEIIKKHSS